MISAGRIADTLARNGHDVTFASIEAGQSITRFPRFKNHTNIVPLGYVSIEEERKFQETTQQRTLNTFDPLSLQGKYAAITGNVKVFGIACERILKHNATLLQKLKSQKFDAMFTEQLTACGSALSEVLDIPVHFLVSSCTLFEAIADIFGVPTPNGYLPAALGMTKLTDEMTFTERARNQVEVEVVRKGFEFMYANVTALFRQYYGPEFPEAREIIKRKTPFLFIATEDLIDFPRPWPPNVIRIGGLGIDYKAAASAKVTLEEPFVTEMKKGAKGVVFFSLGSNTNSGGLPDSVKSNLFGTFAKYPDYHFIVKLEKGDERSREIINNAPNVYVTTWAPQPALLRHPRLELFITHGGYNSLLEVASAGKPVLLIPMMHDQTRNAAVTERNGWGRSINRLDLLETSKYFEVELTEMLNTDKYKIGAKRIQKLLQTKPFSADQVFLGHVNFALANEGRLPEIRTVAHSLSVVTQYNLDVWGLFLVGVISGVVVVVGLTVLVLKKVTALSSKEKQN
uniref:glucuronosyltransferase n=1 Tax=Panagrellus redivivus TaxID=6233 RepID=A0A7E5A0C0_PANRE